MRENRRRIESNYRLARDWLQARGFNVAPSNAGHFLWVDLGSRLGWTTVDEEEDGFCRLFDAGLYIVSVALTRPTLRMLNCQKSRLARLCRSRDRFRIPVPSQATFE